MAIDVGTAVGYLLLNTSGFTGGAETALNAMKTLRSDSTSTSSKFTALGTGLTTAGAGLTKGITLPLLGVGAAAVKVGDDFEAQMSRVKGISGATEGEMKLLNDQALQLGADTSFSAGEVAEGMENLASSGFTTEEIMAAMPGLLDLAASSGASLGDASAIAAASLRGFGLEAGEAGHVADVFALAAARTNAQTEDMGEAMKYVAPVSKAMGQSLEETAAAIGIMSDAGIKGSQAGTSLRGAMSRLAKPSEKASDKMKELGVSFYDAEGKMLPLNGIVSTLQGSFKGLTQEQQNNALITIFGQESLSGMLALIDRGPEELVSLTEALKDSDGAASDMATTMLDNTKGSLEQMFGSIETLAIKLQQVLAPVVKEVADKITDVVNGLSNMDEGQLRVVTGIAGAIAAIGPVLLVLGKLAGTIGKVTSFLSGAGGLSGALTLLTGPIGIIIAAVAALALAWATDFGGIRDATAEIFGAIQEIIDTVWSTISLLWSENFLDIQTIASEVWGDIELIFSTVFDTIAGLFTVFSQLFQGDWEEAWETIKTLASTIWDTIKTLFSSFLNLIVDTLINIGVRLLKAAKDAFNRVKEGFLEVWGKITSWFSEAINDPIGTIKGIGQAMFDAGASIFTSLWDGLKSIWDTITGWVTNAVDWIVDKVKFWEDESDKVGLTEEEPRGAGRNGAPNAPTYSPTGGTTPTPRGAGPSFGGFTVPGKAGDTYNFYSPEALTPVKTAQELKRAKQELALGHT